MDGATRVRSALAAGESLFRGGRRCTLWRRRSLLRLQISFGHPISPRDRRDAWLSHYLGGTGGSPILSSRHLLLPVTRRWRILVSRCLRRLRPARNSGARDRFDRCWTGRGDALFV